MHQRSQVGVASRRIPAPVPTPRESRARGTGVRVCHLTSVHPPFDTRIFEKECLSLAAAGYDVQLVAPATASTRVRGVTIAAVPPARGRVSRALVTTARVLVQALRARAHVYHFHDPELIPVGVVLRLLGKCVVYDAHEDVPADVLDKTYLPRWVKVVLARVLDVAERAATWRLSRIVAATPAIARRFPAARCVVIQNFPLLTEFGPAAGAPYARRAPVVAYVGLINEIRGITQMVRAIAEVCAHQQARLVLAGRFDRPTFEAEARALDGWRHVDYRGVLPRGRVVEMLAEARLGLVLFHPRPNHLESQPNKLFEYMAAGLPVVASSFPLWKKIVEGSRCGLVVDPLDPQAVAGAIRWLLDHPDEAEAMGARGREAVHDRFNWRREEATLLDCYASLCAENALRLAPS
jgi:glycosyltransferase involved in cell wall biosynthesis